MTRQFKPIAVNLDNITLEGIEVLVTYAKYKDYKEGSSWPYWYIELHSVEVVVCGTGIDILPQMTTKQIHAIEKEVEENL